MVGSSTTCARAAPVISINAMSVFMGHYSCRCYRAAAWPPVLAQPCSGAASRVCDRALLSRPPTRSSAPAMAWRAASRASLANAGRTIWRIDSLPVIAVIGVVRGDRSGDQHRGGDLQDGALTRRHAGAPAERDEERKDGVFHRALRCSFAFGQVTKWLMCFALSKSTSSGATLSASTGMLLPAAVSSQIIRALQERQRCTSRSFVCVVVARAHRARSDASGKSVQSPAFQRALCAR